ncbi:alpha-keto acid decarboxylase family protein (plasmid) [Rhizobium ruizarguesonis]|jgi:indolepyruvate decarboxylase|uniref:alpha-keto acid decarboxylase family protein n=1 Tax=Rhizobium ruizarguesonis TaxID=2081791 RepID=UPI001030B961|nr:thiamine pyrophosphate-dependent enzyme [Rhizobium ruizarguesonis]MBY5887161.1 alpha-keto acid decarboxylase family protein [Rhizobium leguminosarum]NKL42424.1 alpha-keto acid decarboxylase family protein [Rhizobium leguminosarum bv. viciae]NEH39279.1 alpha-keto acid decarboxylase family protein [Rhizobium ruizarguesonis]NEI97518.1 alpha-keto acid decarboxylase family protein [Rhizobium ruizarguesonis]NEJ34057.1 alpha-keto acid decarboxylase family protein [Rhizobium ruizarguesonis]
MGETYTVGQYLVDRLRELGLGHLFSVAGDYSIEWVNSYVEKSGIQVIEEVNELNAGYAADGYARLKGIGALCVTYSAGSLCTTNAIAGSYVEKVPVVLINGAPSIKKTLTFEQTGYSAHHFISGRETDLQVFEYITAAAVRIDSPHLAPMLIDYALTQCITERRPVYIELLEDMVDLECTRPSNALKAAPDISDEDSLNQSIAQISERLQNATKPLIWIGVEIDRFGLHDQAERLIRDLKIPYVTELLSKAILSEDDVQFAGVFDGESSSPYVQSLVKDSDFVLALGVWLTDINDLGWPIDLDKTAFASWDTVKYGTIFNAEVSLADLVNGLIDKRLTCKAQSLPAKTARQAPAVNPAGEITYQGFYHFIQQQIDGNTIVGADASLNYFGSLLLEVGARRGFIVQSSYSAIGYIGPAATGVSLAKQDKQRLLVFAGDGGFQMTAQCLSTQTRFNLNPIIFVMDNGIYGVEQWLADASVFHGNKPFYNSCILHRWNYSKLAEVFGCQGWKVDTYGELEEAINGAKENLNSPSIIQVVVPQRSIPDNANWKAN